MNEAKAVALTRDDIEARRYTYVTCTRRDGGGPSPYAAFLVPSPYKLEALAQASAFIEQQGWGVVEYPKGRDGNCECCGRFALYPRNYVKKARELYAAKLFYVPPTENTSEPV